MALATKATQKIYKHPKNKHALAVPAALVHGGTLDLFPFLHGGRAYCCCCWWAGGPLKSPATPG